MIDESLAILAGAKADLFDRENGGSGDAPPKQGKEEQKEKKPRPPSVAQRLVEMVVKAGVELYHDAENNGYAAVPRDDVLANYTISSTVFKMWMRRAFHAATGGIIPSAEAVSGAIATLQGFALFNGPTVKVYLRVGEKDDKIYLNLADDNWRAVEIDGNGWRVVPTPPVRFRRPKGFLALPEPKRGGSVDLLRPFLNVDGDGWVLAVCWILAALRPQGPHPLMVLSGQQGSAKSTTGRVLRALLDPNAAPIRCEPKEARDLMIAASSGWVIALDNLSHVTPWLSDALCRLSTGGGFSTRQLYSDGEEIIFDAMRPVILSSIEDVVNRGDLLDRAIVLSLPPIPEKNRKPESEFWARFDAVRPLILGALLDTVSTALRILPSIRLQRLPRMADFAIWATACERAMAWPEGTFMSAYLRNRDAANETALESSVLTAPLVKLLAGCARWSGTATELRDALTALADEKTTRGREWPRSPKALAGQLRRLTPNLLAAGIAVEYERSGRGRKRTIVLEKFADDADGRADGADANEKTCVRTKTAKNKGNFDDADDADAKSRPFEGRLAPVPSCGAVSDEIDVDGAASKSRQADLFFQLEPALSPARDPNDDTFDPDANQWA